MRFLKEGESHPWWDVEVLIWMVRKRLRPKTRVPPSVMKYYFERECFK